MPLQTDGQMDTLMLTSHINKLIYDRRRCHMPGVFDDPKRGCRKLVHMPLAIYCFDTLVRNFGMQFATS